MSETYDTTKVDFFIAEQILAFALSIYLIR